MLGFDTFQFDGHLFTSRNIGSCIEMRVKLRLCKLPLNPNTFNKAHTDTKTLRCALKFILCDRNEIQPLQLHTEFPALPVAKASAEEGT